MMTDDAPTNRWWPTFLAVLAVLASMGLVGYTINEAREERHAAMDAAELRTSALIVRTADGVRRSTGARYENRLESATTAVADAAIAIASGNSDALHGLTATEASRAQQMLAELGHRGAMPAAYRLGPPGPPSDDDDLDRLLARSVERSRASARKAERVALWSLLAGAAVAIGGGAALVRSRTRWAFQRTQTELSLSTARRLEALLNDSSDVVLVFATSGELVFQTTSACRHFDPAQLASESGLCALAGSSTSALAEQLHSSGSGGLYRLRCSDGSLRWFDVRVTDLSDEPEVGGRLVTIRDAHREVELRSELETQAMIDSLTNLPNRRVIDPTLELVSRALDPGRLIAMLMLDLDGFKEVNDSLGHASGDELLRQMANRLASVVRSGDTLVRLGGDEFAVVLAAVADEAEAVAAAGRIHHVLRAPFDLDGHLESTKASIGIVLSDGRFGSADLLRMADIALYESKRLGGGRTVVFDPALEEAVSAVATMNRALRDADYDSEFELFFQPIVATAHGNLFALEALLRWNSPMLGPVSPTAFIPLAERTGAIIPLGDWVARRVVSQLSEWGPGTPFAEVAISMNVSARQVAQAGFVGGLLDRMVLQGVDPRRLIVEVTESIMINENREIIERLEELRRAGVRIAVDDFGSGYSNLGQLLGLPLDLIKVDRTLLLTLQRMRPQDEACSEGSCAIMQAIVSIAGALGIPLVVEGVENAEQWKSVVASGVHLVQGYLVARPCAAQDLIEQLGVMLELPANSLV